MVGVPYESETTTRSLTEIYFAVESHFLKKVYLCFVREFGNGNAVQVPSVVEHNSESNHQTNPQDQFEVHVNTARALAATRNGH